MFSSRTTRRQPTIIAVRSLVRRRPHQEWSCGYHARAASRQLPTEPIARSSTGSRIGASAASAVSIAATGVTRFGHRRRTRSTRSAFLSRRSTSRGEIVARLEASQRAIDRRRLDALGQSDRASPRAPPGADHRRGHGPARRREGGCMKPDETGVRGRRSRRGCSTTAATRRATRGAFDRALGLDPGELLAFVAATQPDAWARLDRSVHGGEDGSAQPGFLKRVAAELDERGTVDVLRHGVKDLGVDVRLDVLQARARARRRRSSPATTRTGSRSCASSATTTRRTTIDLALLVNGIPVATAELKNPLTGQNVEHAIHQYRHDRDPQNVTLARRCVVHFAVDPDQVDDDDAARGRLDAVPAVQPGSGGARQQGGAGNPPNPDGAPHRVPVGARSGSATRGSTCSRASSTS